MNHSKASNLSLRLGQFSRVESDIWPFFISGVRPDIRFHLPDIWWAGDRISGISSIDKILYIVSNVNYIVLI